MVKLAGPALSLEASGTIAKTITFSRWKGRPYARARVVPSNPKSVGQVGMRAMFSFLAKQWAGLSAPNKATWEDRASAASISPFNAFMSYNQFRWRNFTAPTQDFPEVETEGTETLDTLGAVAGGRSITVTQSVTTLGNAWAIAFFRSPTGTFASAFDNLVAVIPCSETDDVVFVDSPLAPGTYYYDARPLSDDGYLGPEEGEVTDDVI